MQQSLLLMNFTLLTALLLRLMPAFKSRKALAAIGLILCSQAYLASWYLHSYAIERIWRISLLSMVVAQPVFFWLLANYIFDDRFRLRWWHGLIITGKFLLAGVLMQGRPVTNIFTPMAPEHIPRLIPNFFYTLGFVFHAFTVILRTSKSDLVESRRKIRGIALLGTGLLILMALLSAAVLRPMGYGGVGDFISLLGMTAGSFAIVSWGEPYWREILLVEKPASIPEGDPQIMQQAIELMQTQELYRTEGLTIGQLAEKMQVQEYKLRKAINGGLGYRNFNEFLNSCRIQAAKKFLENKENAEYPLIHLALDLGYASPAPFNRAFKEATGLAPGEYRKNVIGRS